MPVSKFLTSRLSSKIWYSSLLAGNQQFLGNRGAFDSIATTTVGAGGAASVTFSSIPSTYTHLQVRFIGRDNRSLFRDFVGLNLNNDTGNNYAYHTLSGDGSSASASNATSFSEIQLFAVSSANANNANGFGTAIIDILDYTNTSKNTTVKALGGYNDNGQGVIAFQSGLWMNTSAVSTVTITPGVGTSFSQNTQIALYGIKGV